MKNIKNINGLTVQVVDDQRVVQYKGHFCPLIKRVENLCDLDTSYFGCLIDSWETYSTPIGVVERHYYARGAGLDVTGVNWRLIPVDEIKEIQSRFEKASLEFNEARKALEMVSKV